MYAGCPSTCKATGWLRPAKVSYSFSCVIGDGNERTFEVPVLKKTCDHTAWPLTESNRKYERHLTGRDSLHPASQEDEIHHLEKLLPLP